MSVSSSAKYATPTRAPLEASSIRSASPSASTPAFEALYAASSGGCTAAASDEIASAYPPGCAMWGPAARSV